MSHQEQLFLPYDLNKGQVIPKKTWIGLLHLSFIDDIRQELVEGLDHLRSRPPSMDQNSSAHLVRRKLDSSTAQSLEFQPSPVNVTFKICVPSTFIRLFLTEESWFTNLH